MSSILNKKRQKVFKRVVSKVRLNSRISGSDIQQEKSSGFSRVSTSRSTGTTTLQLLESLVKVNLL